jgi:farnesyl diphosphate synthase
MSDIAVVLSDFSKRFNARLPVLFKKSGGAERRVVEAMEYAVMNGGKRLRPFLIAETAALFGKDFEQIFVAAASLEMLHTYSLIHDDLPAMDNDDFRRGHPSCHKQFDEATAILAGDGLLTFAFELLARADYEPDVKIELMSLLAEGAGAFNGMVAGQMLDLYAERGNPKDDPTALISRIESMKTGCLLRYACEAGAVIGHADKEKRDLLCRYARKIGIAFQVADDILDVEGDEQVVGKTLQKDEAQNKLTFVSCFGLAEAKAYAGRLIDEAQALLEPFGTHAERLKALARFIIERTY